MKSPIRLAALLLACSATCLAAASFDDEFALSVRAGKGQMTAEEKKALLKDNHPILMQMADKGTAGLVTLFAELPDKSLQQLKTDTYLKWNYKDLDKSRQKVFRDMIQANLDMAQKQGTQMQSGFSLKGLQQSEVGFAIVEIPDVQQKVVSLFVLWPDLPSPTWVTVVNGKAAGTQSYFQAHLKRLPLLKTMPTSTLPQTVVQPIVGGDRVNPPPQH